ncbi:MAG TPA: sugar transferase [Nitrospira sp.]|nr:sugar transferase [Nitrospira sp.]
MHTLESSASTACCPLMDEAVFRKTITKERRRAERSGRTLVLLLARIRDTVEEDREGALLVGAKVFAEHKMEIDTIGWFEAGRTIGLLMPEMDSDDVSATCDRLKVECVDAIVRAVGCRAYDAVAIDLRRYPESDGESEYVPDLMDPFLYPELSPDPGASGGRTPLLKRGMDVVLSALFLTLLSPLFIVLAMMVKCSSRGPIFFRQVRVGHMMKPFVMYKFRTMYEGADHRVHQDYVSWFIAKSKQAQTEREPTVFKLTQDRRITPVGGVLRRTSFDELPQLWNVLKGDMSLVGPRPALPYEVQQYKPWHRGRILEAKPGITGLWQVVGRSRTTFDEMVRLDLQYARSMSVWFDIKIILATPGAMISGKGAH